MEDFHMQNNNTSVLTKLLNKSYIFGIQIARLNIVLSSKFKVLPFQLEYSDDERKWSLGKKFTIVPLFTSSKFSWNRLFYYLNIFQICIHSIYVLFQFNRRVHDGDHLNPAGAIHFVKLICTFCGFILYWAMIFRGADLIRTVQAIDKIENEFQTAGVDLQKWWESMVTSIMLLGVAYYWCVLPTFFSIFVFFTPKNSMYLVSQLPSSYLESKYRMFILMLFAIFEYYSLTCIFFIFLLCISSTWSYFISMLIWMRYLFRESKRKEETNNPVDFRKKFKIYKLMTLTTHYFNAVIYPQISFFVFGVTGMTVVCLFVSATGHDVLPIQIYFMFPFLTLVLIFTIFVTFSQLGQIKTTSTRYVPLWKHELSGDKKESMRSYNFKQYYGSMKLMRNHVYDDEMDFGRLRENYSETSKLTNKELRQIHRSLRPFGIRMVTIYCSLKTPQRMVEQVLTYFILMLQLEIKLVG